MVRFLYRLTILVPSVLAGCTPAPPEESCAPGTGTPMAVFTLYLGKSLPGRGDLTEPEWRAFQAGTVTANLPDLYTVRDGNGGWMNPVTHTTMEEASKVLVAALPESPDGLATIQRILSACRRRFRQRAVGMMITRACGSFWPDSRPATKRGAQRRPDPGRR